MRTTQKQALRAERLRENQALSQRCTAVDGVIKKKIFMVVHKLFLSPIMDQLIGFGQMTVLKMLQHLFRSYGGIDEIKLEENVVKMMGEYDPS